jgi:pimeloyl-ACP methyl ester carboxylesterase
MKVVAEISEKGVLEQRFDLETDGGVVPGILWRPAASVEPSATILIGHGGTQHKRAPNVLGLARRFVRHLGYAAVALDAPGHGDRITDEAAATEARRNLERRIASGPTGRPFEIPPDQAKAWVERTRGGVAEWKVLLDHLPSAGLAGPYGYWGVSMGTAIGLPFVSSEPRISAAVLGLAGMNTRPGSKEFEEAARALSIPILFVFQWDDELMNRESGLELFDAIGSQEKTMHINPGGHVGTPLFERDSYEAFFARHFGRKD